MQMIRFLFLEEESSYAACWVQEVNQLLLKKGQDQGKEELEERTGQWEPLDNLLPPYNPNIVLTAAAAAPEGGVGGGGTGQSWRSLPT